MLTMLSPSYWLFKLLLLRLSFEIETNVTQDNYATLPVLPALDIGALRIMSCPGHLVHYCLFIVLSEHMT